MADGTIPENQKEVLLKMGDWLQKYGEAIYETRPWYTFGEGPTKEPEGHFKNYNQFQKIKYSEKDIRYTTNTGVVYALILGCPRENQQILLESFGKDVVPEEINVINVSILGSEKTVSFELKSEGLIITTPDTKADDMAVVFKIEIN